MSTKPQKEKSDISIGDVINNGKPQKKSFRKMINPQKYVGRERERRRRGKSTQDLVCEMSIDRRMDVELELQT